MTFAQYEREIIGERIRDKFAASKRKGCGWAAWRLGYCVQNRVLVVADGGRDRAASPPLPTAVAQRSPSRSMPVRKTKRAA